MTAVSSKRRTKGAMREGAAREETCAQKAAICLKDSIAAVGMQVHGVRGTRPCTCSGIAFNQKVTAIPLAADGLTLAVDLVEPTSSEPSDVVSKL